VIDVQRLSTIVVWGVNARYSFATPAMGGGKRPMSKALTSSGSMSCRAMVAGVFPGRTTLPSYTTVAMPN
jgi:hypothetical protein